MRTVLVLALLGGIIESAALFGQSPKAVSSPEEAAVGFYKWYVHQINDGHLPLTQSHEIMSRYVSPSLLKFLESRSKSGFESDYFLKAQDTLEDWETNVSAARKTVTGKTADMIVTLGASKGTRHRLSVELVRDGDHWKINKVRAARNPE